MLKVVIVRASGELRMSGPPRMSTTRTAEIWLGEDEFVHVRPFAGADQDLPDAVENMATITRLSGGVRRPLVIHWQRAASLTHSCRAYYMSPEALDRSTAVAVVTTSTLGRVLGNLMIGMTKRVRVRLFQDETSAAKWLVDLTALRLAEG